MVSAISRIVVVKNDGEVKLEKLPFHAGDTLEIIVVPRLRNTEQQQQQLRGTVLKYIDPFEPVSVEHWESL